VVCDASFIALRKVLEVPLSLAARPTRLVALIKPQFEVGRSEVGKGGVVRDPALHARVCGKCATGWKAMAGTCRASSKARSPARKATWNSLYRAKYLRFGTRFSGQLPDGHTLAIPGAGRWPGPSVRVFSRQT
jgi:hypothetical protein